MLVAILSTNYAEKFFKLFENKFLENDCQLLIKVISILRTTCKKTDKLNSNNLIGLNPIIPMGKGWECTIEYIYKNKGKVVFEREQDYPSIT